MGIYISNDTIKELTDVLKQIADSLDRIADSVEELEEVPSAIYALEETVRAAVTEEEKQDAQKTDNVSPTEGGDKG